MTEPALPGPEGIRPELLAAYVDGELPPELCAVVESWLAAHPESLEDLASQKQLAPTNWPLWLQAEPPLPTADTWAAMRERIADVMLNEPVAELEPVARSWKWLAVAASLAATVLVAWFSLKPGNAPIASDDRDVAKTLPLAAPADDPLAEYAVLPIAAAVEVDVQRVMGDPGNMFAVGEPPLDGPLILATEDEVELETVEDHPAWPNGGPVTVPTPGDAPLIFANSPR